MIELYPHQKEAVSKLSSGSILCGGVGSGKSITALTYFFVNECGGRLVKGRPVIKEENIKPLYIITTARKRDTLEWEEECERFNIEATVIDSWNNVHKYINVKESAFFIFDEQRVVGSGLWVKSFIKIARKHRWLLLTATPGDTWLDYIPVFMANGFYRTRSDFLENHAVYNRYSKYPKIDRFINVASLERLRRSITVVMDYKPPARKRYSTIRTEYDRALMKRLSKDRWNPYDDQPIRDISELCYLMRKAVNSDDSRIEAIRELMKKHPKLIIFYNFNYELDILRTLSEHTSVAEWNGHKHQPIPKEKKWAYLVQYAAGAEGWNCIETDAVAFYSQNYSNKATTQAAGRIDRVNSPFSVLYYYTLTSASAIDMAITRALHSKRDFNEELFAQECGFVEKTRHIIEGRE